MVVDAFKPPRPHAHVLHATWNRVAMPLSWGAHLRRYGGVPLPESMKAFMTRAELQALFAEHGLEAGGEDRFPPLARTVGRRRPA